MGLPPTFLASLATLYLFDNPGNLLVLFCNFNLYEVLINFMMSCHFDITIPSATMLEVLKTLQLGC